MATNKFGVKLDSNGYAPSLMQSEEEQAYCYRCGRSCEKLDRHEPLGGANREKSKELGLWVVLCHFSCHQEAPHSVHKDASEANRLRVKAQRVAMKHYGWSTADFIREFGRSYL